MDTIVLRARGKINLTLDVVGKRENGYHDLRMIMQSINLYDTIKVKKTKSPGIKIENNLSWLPTDDKNIAYKAAQLFLEETGIESGIYINIHKRIPVAAGLAGGSSNAAAVLVGLNKIFETEFSRRELMEMGLKLGADVPFCVLRGTALAEGIGEKLTVLPSFPYMNILLAKPNISVSTASVYKNLDIKNIRKHPQTDKVVEAIRKGNKDFVIDHMENVLQEVTIKMHPQVQRIKDNMLKQGALGTMMSGSGPTVFGIFENREDCLRAAEFFKEECGLREVHVTSTYYQGRREGKYRERRKFKYANKRVSTT
ncbi:MAG: 4-(cytidine 5'-diphospho)-2-C-methyl-D-erythritol kinase [Cellulosilyticaceae bacterium]